MEAKTLTTTTFERMRTVKAACDNAPAGPGKDAAMRHYLSAEKAEAAKHDGECSRQLDAAARALA
ncbi:MAG: hypothetical protein ACXIUV_12065 [Alkalilacustris sp.]